jgi:multidrug efflux pump subunit AcrA (membrane-fusion protein)
MKKLILTLLLLAAVLLLLGGAGVQIWYATQNQKQADFAGAEYLAQGPIVGWRIVADGRVDPIDGKIGIVSEVPGILERVNVQEGQRVARGDVLAVVRDDRQASEVEVARAELLLSEARLRRLEAGTGGEERAAARARVRAAEEELAYVRNELDRHRELSSSGVISTDEFDNKQQAVRALESRAESLRKESAALSRGAFREERLMAEAEVEMFRRRLERAELELDKCTVRAPSDGVVLELYCHAGDYVSAGNGRPIMSFADADRLQIRAEIVEGDVYEIHPGLEGRFFIPGVGGERSGKLAVNRVLPDFQNRRLMMTDTRIPVDARTTVALCDILDSGFDVYPGQRVTVMFVYAPTSAREGDLGLRPGEDGDAAPHADSEAQVGPLRGLLSRMMPSDKVGSADPENVEVSEVLESGEYPLDAEPGDEP